MFFKKQKVKQINPIRGPRNKTESETLLEFAEFFGDISEYKMDKEIELEMFDKLKKVENFNEYLRSAIARDMQRYFAATDDVQRNLIKGTIARTSYLKGRMAAQNESKEVKSSMLGLQYNRKK